MSEVSQPKEQYRFTCDNCAKVIDGLSLQIFMKAYEGQDLCLSCRPSKPSLIETIEKALEESTPGQWLYDHPLRHYNDEEGHSHEVSATTWEVVDDETGSVIAVLDTSRKHDAHLIANAPEWLRALLNEVEQLRGALGYSMPGNVNLRDDIVNGPAVALGDQLQQTREELTESQSMLKYNQEMYDQVYESRKVVEAELEQVKAERSKERMIYSMNMDEANQLIETMCTELSAWKRSHQLLRNYLLEHRENTPYGMYQEQITNVLEESHAILSQYEVIPNES